MPGKCPSGKIMRRGSSRKGHSRKSYRRSDGTKVKASRVKQSRMAGTCIKDVGQPGHGPYVLPKLGEDVSLSKQGYSLSRPSSKRRQSLKKASKKYGTLEVLRRVNLISNYSKSVKTNYNKLRDDVEFMKREYAKEKKVKMSRSKSKKSKKSKRSRK